MATIAVFGVLGGGAAYAANTIGSDDVINNSLLSADLKNNAAVQSADVRNNTLTGDDVDEATLQNVNAGSVGGLQVRKINFQVSYGTPPTVVLDLAGLQITAQCADFGDRLDVKAFTTKNGSSVAYFSGYTGGADDTNGFKDIASTEHLDREFDVGDQLQIDDATPDFGQDSIGTLQYWNPDGSVVVAHIAFDELPTGCALTGIATGG
jgi:hypothetical protein